MTTQEKFIIEIAPIIIKECKERGYCFPSAIVAQSCLESNYGASLLSLRYHNYFGMKCGSGYSGKSVNMATKEEYTKGTLTNIRDNFRAYDTREDGIKGYFQFISSPRYANLKGATSAYNYLYLIKSDNYATSSNYVDNVNNVIIKYQLHYIDVALNVIKGYYGNGDVRKAQIEKQGLHYPLVQEYVNLAIKAGCKV